MDIAVWNWIFFYVIFFIFISLNYYNKKINLDNLDKTLDIKKQLEKLNKVKFKTLEQQKKIVKLSNQLPTALNKNIDSMIFIAIIIAIYFMFMNSFIGNDINVIIFTICFFGVSYISYIHLIMYDCHYKKYEFNKATILHISLMPMLFILYKWPLTVTIFNNTYRLNFLVMAILLMLSAYLIQKLLRWIDDSNS